MLSVKPSTEVALILVPLIAVHTQLRLYAASVKGKVYKRAVEYHIVTSLAIAMMRFDAISASFPSERLIIQCESFRKALHDHDPAMNEIYDGIAVW